MPLLRGRAALLAATYINTKRFKKVCTFVHLSGEGYVSMSPSIGPYVTGTAIVVREYSMEQTMG
jgi:hypothetical protein